MDEFIGGPYSRHRPVVFRETPHSDNRPEIKAGKLLSRYFIDVSCRFSENLKFPLNRTNTQSGANGMVSCTPTRKVLLKGSKPRK
jgi:hypothetical protein